MTSIHVYPVKKKIDSIVQETRDEIIHECCFSCFIQTLACVTFRDIGTCERLDKNESFFIITQLVINRLYLFFFFLLS